jgi:hypothetical protein
MIMQLNARTLSRLQSSMMQAQRYSAHKRLSEYGHLYVNFAHKQPELWYLLFEHRPANPESRPDNLIINIDALFNLVNHALGELKPNSTSEDVLMAGHTLWSSIHGITVLMLQNKLYDGNCEKAQDAVKYLISHFLAGWIPQGETHA